jgi:GT2 family glycosyltransferase
MADPVSIVIPNYNGEDLLKRNLPAVIAAVTKYPGGAEILVVDDASSDASVSYVQGVTGIRLITRPVNGGFSAACRSGVEAATHPIVILLNTDARPFPDFIAPLAAAFQDERVLAVSCLGYVDDTCRHGEGAKIPFFRRGVLKLRNVVAQAARPSLYAIGGHCAFSRAKFLELGGFDGLFAPFYWEDADLCYRGWKRGWTTLFEPASRVVHDHQRGAILKAWGPSRSQLIYGRNSYLFVWKNITSRRMLLGCHLPHLAARLLLGFLWLDLRFYREVFAALRRLRAARRHARLERGCRVWSDEEIWRRIQSPVQQPENTERSVHR